jgi:cation transport ATPase
MKKKSSLFKVVRWQLIVFIAMLISIGLHFLLSQTPFRLILRIATNDIPLLIVLLFGGIPLIAQIVIKIFRRDLGADALAAIAILTGIYLGEYLAASIVMLMVASGQFLESYAVRKASSVLLELAKRMPSKAHLKTEKSIEEIMVNKIKVGDILIIYPHEICPSDGIVMEGNGSMDESYLSGEPYQVAKAPGTLVLSGSINGETLLVIRATNRPQDSRY